MQDGIDLFESGMSILFDEPEISCGDHGESTTIQFAGLQKIQLNIPDVDPKNVSLFAHHVWKSSILLSKILLEDPAAFKNTDILEMGAGSGIPSIVASILGANVVASDYPDPEILSKLQTNLNNNTHTKSYVLGHKWGDRNDDLFPNCRPFKKFGYILLADTLWIAHQHSNLLSDLDSLLKDDGTILGVAGLHSGRFTFDSFFAKAQEFGFHVQTMSPIRIPVGHGFCEQMDWEIIPANECISDAIHERNRVLFRFTLVRKVSIKS